MWAASPRPLSSAEMAAVELNAVALGVSLDTLMENAGRAVAEEAARRLPPPPARVGIVASTGNNGGDGTCAAHYLHEWGYSPEVWIVRPPSEIRSRAARRCFERIERRLPVHVRVPRSDELTTMPLVIDALLGTGQADRLRSPIREAVEALRSSRAPILSIDLPTGVRDPEGLRPAWTVALTAPKQEMAKEVGGEVVVREIGIPWEAWRRTGPGEFAFFPDVPRRSERGRSGRVVVIGGGPYSGAPALAALASLRSGAERATVLAPAGAADRIQAFSPNLIVRAVGEGRFRPTDAGDLTEFVQAAPPGCVVVGMGAGAHPETVDALRTVLTNLAGTVPLVVDADALAALPPPDVIAARSGAPLVATPNAGELHRLFEASAEPAPSDRGEAVRRRAAERHLLLVAKGDPDLLSDGETVAENHHHHPAMTVGGAGDVLAGVLGSLLAQRVPALAAARLATYWVGEAGIVAASRKSFGLVATDILEELPAALAAGLARVPRGP
jgi:ADP-dependent NAD(P)H-hydrate dehydratase / NAD(P)H-hydrate epimerase